MKRLLCLGLSLLGGCVTQTTYYHINQQVEMTRQLGVSWAPSPAPITPMLAPRTDPPKPQCAPFRLPPAGLPPLLPDLTDRTLAKTEAVDQALVAYIRDLKAFIHRERQTLEQQYRIYRKRCAS